MKTRVAGARLATALLAPLLLLVGCSGSVDTKSSGTKGETTATSSFDPACDGTLILCRRSTYDADGREIFTESDADCDGQQDPGDGCIRTTYDEAGNIAKSEDDTQCDGVLDACTSTQHDVDGNELSGTDDGCDGSLDRNCVLYAGEEGPAVLYFDDNCDGARDKCNIVTRRADGSVERVEDDSDCDGVPGPCAESATYDEGRHQTYFAMDSTCSGTPRNCLTTTYANGVSVSLEVDDDCDGAPESCTEYVRTQNGTHLVTRTDEGCDGTLDRCRLQQYDEEHKLIGDGEDADCDGEPEGKCSNRVVEGNTETWQSDENCDGTPETCTVYTFDGDQQTSGWQDADCDGKADSECYQWTRQ